MYCKKKGKLKLKTNPGFILWKDNHIHLPCSNVSNNSLPCVTVDLNAISWLICGAVVNTGTGVNCDALSFTVRHHPLWTYAARNTLCAHLNRKYKIMLQSIHAQYKKKYIYISIKWILNPTILICYNITYWYTDTAQSLGRKQETARGGDRPCFPLCGYTLPKRYSFIDDAFRRRF